MRSRQSFALQFKTLNTPRATRIAASSSINAVSFSSWSFSNRCFEFDKRGQLFIRTYNVTPLPICVIRRRCNRLMAKYPAFFAEVADMRQARAEARFKRKERSKGKQGLTTGKEKQNERNGHARLR
jgi:hypothetical protein